MYNIPLGIHKLICKHFLKLELTINLVYANTLITFSKVKDSTLNNKQLYDLKINHRNCLALGTLYCKFAIVINNSYSKIEHTYVKTLLSLKMKLYRILY